MTPVSADRRRPLLVVGHGLGSAPPLEIADGASGLCEILWLIDESVPENAFTGRLLRRLGTVVNLAGLSLEETISVLGAHSPDGVVATATRTSSSCL